MEYILLSEEIALSNKGLVKSGVEFNYATTLDNRYVCSKNSLVTFPEILSSLPIIELTNNDFSIPQDPYQ